MPTIELPDGSKKSFDEAVTGMQVAESIGAGLAKAALAIEVDGTIVDLAHIIEKDAKVRILTFKDTEGKNVFWHSSAHVLAIAVTRLYPKTQLTIGPAIEKGFYYDFFTKKTFGQEELEKIEKEMKKVVEENLPFVKEPIRYEDAKKLFQDNTFKLELIEEHKEHLSVYKTGKFIDLCSGPHVPSTGYIKHFTLTKSSAAYWRGDEKKESLQRVYGVSFPEKKELKKYIELLQEAEKRDHRKIGKQLGLFTFSEFVGPGLPLYTPKGFFLRNAIMSFSRELNKQCGYEEVHTPNINKAELFKTSGHYDKYKEDMFNVVSNYTKEEYFLKPMNCPQHTQIFASQARSYRDLPIRYADFANLHRDEKPGELGGLTRLRCFCQDDGHSFCREDQIEDEFKRVLKAIEQALKTYQLDYWIRLSLRDPKEKEKYLGDDETWETSEKAMRDLLKKNKITFKEAEGEAAFYGPKMDIMATDALGREWQISTIQLDMNMPKRFDLTYMDEQGKEKTPVMIHRALVGSPERFMGILIEHFAGKFPLWLNPNQVMIVPVADRFNDYAQDVASQLKEAHIQVDIDERSEGVSKKVRDAQLHYYNYILVVGEKEVADKQVTVRTREGEVEGIVAVETFLERVVKERDEKR